MEKCYWKIISESKNREGLNMQEQNKYINFSKCRNKCDGKDLRCCFYEGGSVYEMMRIEKPLKTKPTGLEDFEFQEWGENFDFEK